MIFKVSSNPNAAMMLSGWNVLKYHLYRMNFLAEQDFAEVLCGSFGESFVFNGVKAPGGRGRAKQLPVTVLYCCLLMRSRVLY